MKVPIRVDVAASVYLPPALWGEVAVRLRCDAWGHREDLPSLRCGRLPGL